MESLVKNALWLLAEKNISEELGGRTQAEAIEHYSSRIEVLEDDLEAFGETDDDLITLENYRQSLDTVKNIPQHRDKKFASDKDLSKWLHEIGNLRVELEETGMDLTSFVIDKHGEIIHCNLQQEMWLGRFIKLPVRVGEPILMWFAEDMKWTKMKRMIVEETVTPRE